jgi:hypothetical protein
MGSLRTGDRHPAEGERPKEPPRMWPSPVGVAAFTEPIDATVAS